MTLTVVIIRFSDIFRNDKHSALMHIKENPINARNLESIKSQMDPLQNMTSYSEEKQTKIWIETEFLTSDQGVTLHRWCSFASIVGGEEERCGVQEPSTRQLLLPGTWSSTCPFLRTFSTSALVTFGIGSFFMGGPLVNYEMFCSISALCPMPSGHQLPSFSPLSCNNWKCLQILPNVPLKAKSSLFKDNCLKDKHHWELLPASLWRASHGDLNWPKWWEIEQ